MRKRKSDDEIFKYRSFPENFIAKSISLHKVIYLPRLNIQGILEVCLLCGNLDKEEVKKF